MINYQIKCGSRIERGGESSMRPLMFRVSLFFFSPAMAMNWRVDSYVAIYNNLTVSPIKVQRSECRMFCLGPFFSMLS